MLELLDRRVHPLGRALKKVTPGVVPSVSITGAGVAQVAASVGAKGSITGAVQVTAGADAPCSITGAGAAQVTTGDEATHSHLPPYRRGEGRRGRHFSERGRRPRKCRDPKPRTVVDFTGGPVADLTLRSTPDSISINLSIHPTIKNVRTNVAT